MSGQMELPGVGKATTCQVATHHTPRPRRWVWHHIQPLTCGGITEPGNLAQLCDNCHYGIHQLMWDMAHGVNPGAASPGQKRIASEGYARCVAAGTVANIPQEG